MKRNIFITVLLIIIFSNLSIVLNSVKDASLLFFNKIFLSVFPFIILSDLLFYFNYHIFIRDSIVGKIISRVFNIDSVCTTIFLFSIFTSQPNNALYIKTKLDEGTIDINNASKLLCFTYFPSVFFVIGTIGILMFNSIKIGLFLYFNSILNNLLIGLYLKGEYISLEDQEEDIKTSLISVLNKSFNKIFNNCYIILGNLIIFTIVINILSNLINLNGIHLCIFASLFEITNAINNIFILDISLYIKLFLISFSLNFGGLSILFQSFSILSDYDLNIKKILIIKLIFSLITSVIFIMFPILIQAL